MRLAVALEMQSALAVWVACMENFGSVHVHCGLYRSSPHGTRLEPLKMLE